ncbi:hypothetical protein OPQ81_000392 [Rhizoctonia solani]|nr:hypothetical protein OPQ81_000392 [Rhizoctonia solani]
MSQMLTGSGLWLHADDILLPSTTSSLQQLLNMAKKQCTTRTSQARPARKSDTKSDKEAPRSDPSERVSRHPEFFFDDTLVTILVENTLFNVHKYQLAKSEVFSERFKARKRKGVPQEGSSPERPIKLNGVSASDFAALLKVLYASYFSSNPPPPEAPLVLPAFRLANLLRFSELRAFLLPLAEKHLDDVDKVILSRQFDIKEWLAPAHVRLCQREKPLSGEEARKLGVESVLIISRMREQHRNRFTVNCNYCSPCAGMTYTGKDYQCNSCGGTHGMFRYHGVGRVAPAAARTDNTAIEAGVKKWVEAGCRVED